ncbi:piggyBac transposable element-derived protein 4-like [Acanthaster planci]|uniref:PiggyBac transposable element-derived protein 4-like n=1 Tax=Acanthaster planci TaxID=133434 RepID=A0A8B7YB41_ACAPL|nr:piggyBac transposable element-derived protein 4-like [Acanthaster planci]XP_022089600.1 piggyBac transposable element-derived protein 4-like [Acanthaster planci]XP_022089609.1 piggyBac transposable element-derived protein 4-like [Acanthaster planci]XP_022089619.1 piggyBac transposable element-derived protein 4-like [Acanthaster planci]XP_022089626.1 piggyBac transposable element-derived protein 4-like [Acanthaster planci]XP_022089634.1 piggyBac transposable element-derived protein 4-like [A
MDSLTPVLVQGTDQIGDAAPDQDRDLPSGTATRTEAVESTGLATRSFAFPALDPGPSSSGLPSGSQFDYFYLDDIKQEQLDSDEFEQEEIDYEEDGEEGSGDFSEESDFSPTQSEEESSDSSFGEAPPAKRARKQQPLKKKQNSVSVANWLQGGASHSRDGRGWTRDLKNVPVHDFEGCLPYGPTMERPPDDSPLAYFVSFFPMSLFSQIARYTNIAGQSNPNFSKNTTPAEIKAWVGIRMIQGVHSNINNDDDWSTHPGLRNNLVASTMTRARFNIISEHLACTNPIKLAQKAQGQKDSLLAPVKLIWNTVNKACRANYNPRRELCLDEVLIKTNCRKPFFPQRQAELGSNIYAVCESRTGYLLRMMAHSESGHKRLEVPLQIMQPFLGRYHQLFCRTQYTSTTLAKDLLVNQTYLCGTVSLSSKGLPDDCYTRKNKSSIMKMMLKAPRGTTHTWQQGQMTMVVYRDVKVMPLLSTCHQGKRDPLKDFITRNVRKKGTSEVTSTSIPAPTQLIDFMKFKSGVEHSNQLRSYQSCNRHFRAWKKVFFLLIDVARVNAWICYKALTEGSLSMPLNHRMFTVNIATALIAGFAEGTPAYQADVPPVPAINGPNHVCIRMKVKNPKTCVQCRRTGRKTKNGNSIMTRTGCVSCNIHLCRGHCFLEFHSAAE